MIVFGISLIGFGVFIAVVSAVGFDEAKRDGEGLYALPISVLALGVASVVLGVVVLAKWL